MQYIRCAGLVYLAGVSFSTAIAIARSNVLTGETY
jgi:hypothetical protein